MADSKIESVLREDRVFEPPQAFVEQAKLKPADVEALYQAAQDDHEGFWAERAREHIDWHKPFTQTLDSANAPFFKWFTDGELNVSYNCLDRHLDTKGDKTAIIFESDDGEVEHISYRELHARVCRFANALKANGLGKGDRAVIYLPNVPQAAIAMLACARIGAIHSVVFGGFSAPSLRDRIDDAEAKMLITADGNYRGGKLIPLKDVADKALSQGGASIEKVIVLKRSGTDVAMTSGRDIWWHDAIDGQSDDCPPEWVNAEHPLFILYTSGSTGKPKGIQHSTGGYLLGAICTCRWVFDLSDDDVFWCTADVGWITGHTYIAYGPTACGATQVMFEGVPTYPEPDRFWKMVDTHQVTIFYTAPTAIRALMKHGDEYPQRHALDSLKVLGTVGEPINPEAWMWYRKMIGHDRCPIVDTWWQTETGGHMITPIPSYTPTKPGSVTRALPGIDADILDEAGKPVTDAGAGGVLVIKKPWPYMLRTIWGDPERYKETYFGMYDAHTYVAGDSAQRDEQGNFRILGRIDDVVNISGHRLGTMEVESALVAHAEVAEAAVVSRPHEVKGEAIVAFVILKSGEGNDELASDLRNWVAEQLGAIAKPEEIRFADGLPKTRSGKIMRRLLRTVARGDEVTQDVSTLENPQILEQLQARGS
ncbi:acetate--CoA ligase [Salinisphaera hydrothermalis]|uniref:Acetyl-coenzyme A synthetase n=1 Tax=Salinisphaera hydrothermalis (strain C41B8) TaxID=1304275 RepID=A0A084ILB2_SALHC|nr:acetate--CoA ligase [Salinisphaera hydrothermalis]KEZ77496.1 acetyl-CoA synthetase [Salinisphaera hydrothermalis C41B8]